MKKVNRVIITPGEPAGIGPDLVVQLAQRNWPIEMVVCADKTLLQNRASLLSLPLTLLSYKPYSLPMEQKAGTLTLLPMPVRSTVVPGKLDTKNSEYVINTLVRSCDGCKDGEFSALITGPIHKGIINDANIPFTGHTEFLEKYTQSKKTVMMLVTESLRVALVTTHIPVKEISKTLTADLLRNIINILHHDLCNRFGIKVPRILVCGLNPHAGEGGYIGNEEISIIIPVLEELRKKGMHLSGPFPADTIFQSKYLHNSDVVLAMYHDQGLPVLKCQNFGFGVNVTLGLPFIRTSVDHGTALNLVGKNKANVSSFVMALNLAIKMLIDSK